MKEIAGKKPSILISDGTPNFHDAYQKVLTLKNPRTKHIRDIRLKGDNRNKRMECLNGEVKKTLIHNNKKSWQGFKVHGINYDRDSSWFSSPI
jgi:hypothetical protein